MVRGKVSLVGQEQGLRARIMKLAYIRDVGIGTVLDYTVPIMLYILDNHYLDYLTVYSVYIQ
jgi:hypothetical protein